MPVNDLTGLKIKNTYSRLVQIVSGSLYDGLGNPLTITGSQGPSGSIGPSGSQGPSGSNPNIDTGSFVTTSSFYDFTSSYFSGSIDFTGNRFTGDIFIGPLNGNADTSTYAETAGTSSYSTTASMAVTVVVTTTTPAAPGFTGELRLVIKGAINQLYAFNGIRWTSASLA